MLWEIVGSAGFATLDISLAEEEVIRAQPRSMVLMSTGIEITASIGGGVGRGGAVAGLKGLLAGESFANASFRAKRSGERLSLAPDTVGPILPISLPESSVLLIAKGSYLACDTNIVLEAQYGGLKSFLAKKGLFLLKATGPGQLFLTGAGEIREIMLNPDERIAIDNDYVVAFESTVQYAVVTAAKGLKDSVLSGEGIINRYIGPGRVYYQTRSKVKPGMLTTIANTVT